MNMYSPRENSHGFTLVEIITVIVILGILFTSLYLGSQVYFMRSRDTKRVISILQYGNILSAYEKDHETFPSNYGHNNVATQSGACLSELPLRQDIPSLGNEGKFQSLGNLTSPPPTDPLSSVLIAPCTIPGSFIYSRIDYGIGISKQIAVMAARLEVRASGNYGTGADLFDKLKYQEILDAKKGTIPDTAPDQFYIVAKTLISR